MALRTLADIARLVQRFNLLSQTEPGTHDIKRREPGILLISLPIACDYDAIFDFCIDSASLATSFKKYNVIIPA